MAANLVVLWQLGALPAAVTGSKRKSSHGHPPLRANNLRSYHVKSLEPGRTSLFAQWEVVLHS
jgi:hypothetical protein